MKSNELARGTANADTRMTSEEALSALSKLRAPGQIVVTNQMSARLWPQFTQQPALDFNYNPSTMGGAIPFALGLAVAQPTREVIVISGEGALLMNLGSLVTVAAAAAGNLTVVVLDNAMYEVTGGQRTAACCAGTDFEALARGAGFTTAVTFSDSRQWLQSGPNVLSEPGPRFVCLRVHRSSGPVAGSSVPPLEQLRQLTQTFTE